MNVQSLPNDINILKELILQKDQQLKENKKYIEDLKDMIMLLRRKKFASSSEKDVNQIQLFDELEDILEKDSNEEIPEIDIPAHKRKKGGRKPLPEQLPRVEEFYDLSEEDKVGMKYIGDEVTEKLEIKPAEIFVRRIVKRKYVKDVGDRSVFKTAQGPCELLPKTMASASLLSYIITGKYCDALPLYRQEKIFKRIDADLTRQTMSRWIIKVSHLIVPLYNFLEETLLDSNYLQMDETTTLVLKEDGKKATSKSYMWVRYKPGDHPIVLYDYAPTRSGQVPLELLRGFKGHLQVDGYDGYSLACEEGNLTRLGCWDHCRRKFFDASKSSNGKGIGKKGIERIKKLYKIEEKIQNFSDEERFKVRQEKSLPILKEFKEWIDELRPKLTPNSLAGKAVNYTFNEWKYLINFLEDGKLNISNSAVENAIRPFCLGRKNWLFSDTVDGAKASAMFYSLIETAKYNELEPFKYLNYMLEKIPAAKTAPNFEKLLPLKINAQYLN
ncbi:MAG: IS66 family transposase [Halobacteriovoraceae bacterium]|nr:IS66 family transposase [Halobacteriovoraceae bacterium]